MTSPTALATKTTYYVITIDTPRGAEARQFDSAELAFNFLMGVAPRDVLRAYTVTK